MNKSKSILVHLHPDFKQPLEELFKVWNDVQKSWNFIGLLPQRKAERLLLIPGAISDDEASCVAAEIRATAGYSPKTDIIIFTEKRLFDDDYFQLFVGGREADENPPNIGVISLDFLRKEYQKNRNKPLLFRAIISNILFSIGVDCGLEDHGPDVRGCIMDFCDYMPDIEIGLRNGPRFCKSCVDLLKNSRHIDLVQIAMSFLEKPDLSSFDETVTESIFLRGERYEKIKEGFDFDIALSFAGEDRHYAEKLANLLLSANITVFYDQFDQANLWGKNIHAYLSELYRLRAKYCVVFLSANYKRSRWTRLELDAALAREFEEGKEYVLPIRLDETEIDGILSSRGYLSWQRYSPERIVDILKEKILSS